MASPRLRRVLAERSLGEPTARAPCAEPERGRLLGSGRSMGSVADFPSCRRTDPRHTNFMVAGPWFHGEWQAAKGDSIGILPFGGHKTSRRIPGEHRSTFLPLLPARRGRQAGLEGNDVPDADPIPGTPTTSWPPEGVKPTNLYLHADGSFVFRRRRSRRTPAYRAVRIRSGQSGALSRATHLAHLSRAGDWRTWEVADQRFVEDRPDVLTFVSAPLDHDMTVTGPIAAALCSPPPRERTAISS